MKGEVPVPSFLVFLPENRINNHGLFAANSRDGRHKKDDARRQALGFGALRAHIEGE
ncbi:MAG: hypothetical protein MRY74_08785 [Neomegalonema sp.]|nr:hypothetical protein [Neomegalonema sp.]